MKKKLTIKKKINMKIKTLKKWLPTFNVYMHTNGVSITPHFGFEWYKYQGMTSKGCFKAQIHLGWIMWSCQLLWKHN